MSDYTHMLPYSVARWVPTSLVALGTDGFGRSESRQALRDHFEVDARYVVVATLGALCRRGDVPAHQVSQAIKHLGIDPEKVNPRIA